MTDDTNKEMGLEEQASLEGTEYQPEANNTGAPKNFVIRCPRCRWARLSSGLKDDLVDLHEIAPGCVNCGKWRKFQCPNCGTHSMMKRIKGNG